MKFDMPVDKKKKKPASPAPKRVEERVEVPDFMRRKPAETQPQPKKKKAVFKKKTPAKKKNSAVKPAVLAQATAKPNSKAVHSKQHKRAKKRRRRGSRILYYILFGTLALIIVFVLSVTVLFNIDTITVIGDESADKEQIILESGIQFGDNLFRTDINGAAKRVLQNHVKYDAVYVERNFPTGVTIRLEPAKIAAICVDNATYYSVSSGGRVIEVSTDAPAHSAYALVYGCALPGVEYGDRLVANDTNKLEALWTVLDAIEDNALSGVTHIDLRDLSTIRLFWRGQAELKFGGLDGLSYEVSCVKKLLESKLNEDELVVIDATLMNGTYYKRPVAELDIPGKAVEPPVDESSDEAPDGSGDTDPDNGDSSDSSADNAE